MVSLSSSTSPWASTEIFCVRSPLATAVVTWAMLRTWSVRLAAIRFTLSVSPRHVPDTPSTRAWPPSSPSVPTSRATRVTSSAKEESWSTIVLIVFLSSRISPWASTVIFCERSPSATAVVTCAMLRTWSVRLSASWLTFSVRPRQVPDTPCTSAWPPRMPSVPTSRATRVTSSAKEESWSTIVLIVRLSSRISPCASTVIWRRQVAVGHGGRDLGDVAHLVGQVRRHRVHGLGEVLPRAGDARHVRLTAEHAERAHLARDARHLLGERAQRVGHVVHGLGQRRDLALGLHRDLLRQVAARDGGRDLRDLAHLVGQVRGHHVHGVGQVAPRARGARHLGLAAQHALGAHLARDARHLARERAQRVGHVVDRRGQARRPRPWPRR